MDELSLFGSGVAVLLCKLRSIHPCTSSVLTLQPASSILATRHDPDPSKNLLFVHRLIRRRHRISRGLLFTKAKMTDGERETVEQECLEATHARTESGIAVLQRDRSTPALNAKKRKCMDDGISEQDRLPYPVKRSRKSAGIVMYGYPMLDNALKELKRLQ